MASACRDAKSCVSRGKNAATAGTYSYPFIAHSLLVRRKILRLYFLHAEI